MADKKPSEIILEKLEFLEKNLDIACQKIIELEGVVKVIEEQIKKPESVVVTGITRERTFTDTSMYVPVEYRDIVDSVLNKFFGIKIEPKTDSPAFLFSIVVPDRYSNITPAYKEIYQEDIRPKVITFAEGTVAIRDWAEKVFNSFNPDFRAMIVMDRATNI